MENINPKFDKVAVVKAVETLEKNRTGIVLTGRVKAGKVELDPACLEDISKKFPNAEMSFVAVNAPFDPQSHAIH
jgi:hypothetical protein